MDVLLMYINGRNNCRTISLETPLLSLISRPKFGIFPDTFIFVRQIE